MSETRTVREAIEETLDADEIHGLAVTSKRDETVYLVVSQSTTWGEHEMPVLDLRTVVVDLESESVSVSDNGMWVPRDSDVSLSLTRLLGRTTTDLSTDEDLGEPATLGAVDDLEPEWVLEREVPVDSDDVDGQHVDKMRDHAGIDPSRDWGYGAGPPPEVSIVVGRLEEAGLDPSEHLSRLVWGKKEPMDRVTRPVSELVGNYGIELQPRDSGLVALDVDYPEEFDADDDLPETLEVSSPHGTDDQRHIILRCDDKERLADELGAWAVQSVGWGDLWVGDRYVVGPGSQLSEFGCDQDPHDRGERGGCEACEDPEAGRYRIVDDAPIAKVEPETVLDLVDQDDGEPRDRPVDPDVPGDDDEDVAECGNCGAVRDVDDLERLEVAGRVRYLCPEECEG
jgi:hypothetical protein